MEIKKGEASVESTMTSEVASAGDMSIDKLAERKKKKKEVQNSEHIQILHLYTAILHDKPLSLKGDEATVQEKGKKHLVQDKQTRQRDMSDSATPRLNAGVKVVTPFVVSAAGVNAVHDVGSVEVNSVTTPGKVQQSIVSFLNQGDGKTLEKPGNVTVPEKSHAVDALPLGEPAFAYRSTHEITPQSNAPRSQRNEQMTTPFTSITQQERLSGLRIGENGDDHTVRISYPFQRWFGEHSVKVSLRRDSLYEGAMVLQPSDVRASEALSRQLEHWPKQTPEILRPDSTGDEQREGQQQREQEEEQ